MEQLPKRERQTLPEVSPDKIGSLPTREAVESSQDEGKEAPDASTLEEVRRRLHQAD